jgi:hypothetical protein
MSDYLSASELADLVGCKPNQRTAMVKWLDDKRWKYETDRHGLPKVARAYYNRKMGISDDNIKGKYADTPNLASLA